MLARFFGFLFSLRFITHALHLEMFALAAGATSSFSYCSSRVGFTQVLHFLSQPTSRHTFALYLWYFLYCELISASWLTQW